MHKKRYIKSLNVKTICRGYVGYRQLRNNLRCTFSLGYVIVFSERSSDAKKLHRSLELTISEK